MPRSSQCPCCQGVCRVSSPSGAEWRTVFERVRTALPLYLPEVGYPYVVEFEINRTKTKISTVFCLKILIPPYMPIGKIRENWLSAVTTTFVFHAATLPAGAWTRYAWEPQRYYSLHKRVRKRNVWKDVSSSFTTILINQGQDVYAETLRCFPCGRLGMYRMGSEEVAEYKLHAIKIFLSLAV